jgi:hypothetical protein
MDSAFFSDEIIGSLDAQGVEYTVSVPFERFAELKQRIEARRWWWPLGAGCAYFEAQWKPNRLLKKSNFCHGERSDHAGQVCGERTDARSR